MRTFIIKYERQFVGKPAALETVVTVATDEQAAHDAVRDSVADPIRILTTSWLLEGEVYRMRGD